MIRIVLADDHPLFREGLRGLLDIEADMQVVGEAQDGAAAVRVVALEQPDVVLLDVEMPGQDVLVTVAGVRSAAPHAAVVMLTMHDDRQLITQLLAMGVRGYVLKNIARLELLSVVRGAAQRADHVTVSVSARAFLETSSTPAPDILSDREREVLELAAEAFSNAQIARRLGISEATVKRHMYNTFAKLGAVSRLDAVNKYFRARGANDPG